MRRSASRARWLALAVLAAPAAVPLAAQGLPVGRADRLGFSTERLARIDRAFQDAVDQGRLAGAVAIVVRHGRTAYLRSFGQADREAGRAMTPDALFRIASQTKALTSVAAMILVEEGRLSLDDGVAQYVPAFADARVSVRTDSGPALVPLRRPITIRHLLTQTAGLSYGGERHVRDTYRAAGLGPAAGYGWYFADKDEPICTTMERLATLPLVAQPGETWVYGYASDLLGCVVERASGQPLDVFIRTRITEPLRMRDTWFFVPPGQRDRLTAVYAAEGGGIRRAEDGSRGQGAYVDGPRMSFSGGAGLVSTASDYARFLQMLLNGGVLDGTRILSPATVRLMTTDHVDTLYGGTATGFGLGFQILHDPGRAGQYGSPGLYSWGGAYGSAYWVDPAEDLVAVFLIQQIPRGPVNWGGRFRTLVYQAIEGPGRR